MDRKKLFVLLGAMVIAIGAALAARSMFAGAATPNASAAVPQVPKGPKVLVAQRSLPVGTIVTAEAIGYQQWPAELVKNVYFIEGEADISKLLGTVVRNPITAGQPLTQESLVKPGDRGFLAAALGPGMRAITIPVTDQSGVAGFVFPGDHVDLVLTQSVEGGEGGESLKAAETILSNIRVLATDQFTNQRKSEDGSPLVETSRTVTLEVTPRIAEKIAVAQTIGTISLSLRSMSDAQGELEKALASGEIKIPDNATPEEEEALLKQAMLRPVESGATATTGGDVSRFQRTTLPPKQRSNSAPAPVAQAAPVRAYAPAPAPAPVAAAPRPAAPPKPRGPVVRISRGNTESSVTIGANGQASGE